MLTFSVLFVSCGGDDEPSGTQKVNLVGTWYGTHYYNNPVGGIKYQYITLDLNSDGTGSFEYEGPVSTALAYFTWTASGKEVNCIGVYANSSGDYDTEFTLRLTIDGDRLIPQERYTSFILTKDRSVLTDGNGNEVEDPDEQYYRLQNVWVATDGTSVIIFYPSGDFDEYTLSSPFGKEYKSLYSDTYYFSPLTSQLQLGTTTWDVTTFTETSLTIKNGTTTIAYNMGSSSDIPSAPDLQQYLCSAYPWISDNSKYTFGFRSDGYVFYLERSEKKLGSFGYINLRASGSYTVSGNQVTCKFTEVFWESGDSNAKDYFPGWTYGQSCTKTYTIEVTPSGDIEVTLPSGTKVYLEK